MTVVVHDMLGREVTRLLDAERESGLHRLVWDARANGRNAAASGVYYARVTAVTATGIQIETRAMVLLK